MLLVHVGHSFPADECPLDTAGHAIPLGEGRFSKINADTPAGGPRLAARTVAELTGNGPSITTSDTNFGAASAGLVDLGRRDRSGR